MGLTVASPPPLLPLHQGQGEFPDTCGLASSTSTVSLFKGRCTGGSWSQQVTCSCPSKTGSVAPMRKVSVRSWRYLGSGSAHGQPLLVLLQNEITRRVKTPWQNPDPGLDLKKQDSSSWSQTPQSPRCHS